MVTDAPTAPEVGVRLVILGAAFATGTKKMQKGKTARVTVLKKGRI
jgi:hypothetical protein